MPGLEEPILPRLNRLDNILRQLEDIRGDHHHSPSPRRSYASASSSGTLTSDGHPSFDSPDRLEKHCRPLNEVMLEVEQKGTLMDRLLNAEDRILKLEEEYHESKEHTTGGKNSPKKALKHFVQSCVGAKHKHKTNKA